MSPARAEKRPRKEHTQSTIDLTQTDALLLGRTTGGGQLGMEAASALLLTQV